MAIVANGTSGAPGPARRAVTVVVVAGTHVRLTRLRELLDAVGIDVVGAARTVDAAVDLVVDLEPDTVLLDLALEAGGLALVERVMARRATPIVLSGAASETAGDALAAGAVDLVAPGAEALGSTAYALALARHLQVASRVRVITHPRARLRERGLAAASRPQDPSQPVTSATRRPPVVVVGASTGGPPALAHLLADLPADLPAPVVVVQHMAEGFVEGLARWLDGVVDLPVSVALNGDRLRPGHIVLAPSDGNLVVDPGLRVSIEPPRPGQFHVPEIDVTFRSVAIACRERAVAALLTGMGRDGAAGMLALRRAGAFTIAQDEGTSVVWGMPGAAAALDGVDVELPLPEIAPRIVAAVGRLTVAQAV